MEASKERYRQDEPVHALEEASQLLIGRIVPVAGMGS
jgi:hypothetical protein